MAKRKKRRPVKKQQDYPGWVWMMFGLAIGLSVAFAIYMKDRNPQIDARPVAQESASMSADMNEEPPPPVPAEATAERRFDFYDMLPNFEVVIPENEADVRPDTKAAQVVKPGIYVLQAGSFTEYADADRRRAQLALQGIESRIQKITIDDKAYHRVRIGPLDDLDELNNIRSRLHQANIDVLRIRLGD